MEFHPESRNSLFAVAVLYIKVSSTKARMENPRQLLEASLEAALKVPKSLQYHID
jgi:hypothetical protein